ncbi:MAG TPA: BON domain-containing protein, partial [Candidatus Limnocylindria bacterium]|nr:BON domain-containing protein [Candidatus Limnocylindria bacterium]
MARNDWMSSVRDARRRAETLRRDDRPGPGRFVALGLLGALAGAAAAFLLDPERGRSRRARLADQTAAFFRDVSGNLERGGRYLSSTVQGKAEALRAAGTAEAPPNDAALAMKVESELFRDPDVPKGDININVEQGIVVLRGQVADPSMSERLEKAARAVPGVWEVENLLHLPGEPA